MAVIEVKGISKCFKEKGKKFWALREVNLSIREGTIFSLLGPNGAGKSTLLNIMTNVLSATEGEVRVLGKDVSKNIEVLEKIGFMSGDSYFHWSLNARDILNFYGRLYGVGKKVRKRRIEELIKKFDLEKVSRKKFEILSTGERIRLVLAKALIHKPKILLLDEPTTGLDPEMARRVRKLIKRLNKKGVTVVLTSHNMREVEELSDEVGFIYEGRVVDLGTVEKVKMKHFSNYDVYFKVKEVYGKVLLERKGFLVRGKVLKKSLGMGEDLSEWLAFLHGQGLVVENVETKRPSLEDYFVKIMRK